jgi:hypothetical protein
MKNKIKNSAIIILFAKVLVKTITVLFKTTKLNAAAKRLKAKTLADNLDTQVLTFGVMSPTTIVVRGMVTAGINIATARANAEILVKALTKQENDNAKLIVQTIRDNGMNPIKIGAAGSVALVTGVGADVKGEGPAPDKTRFAATWPEPISVNQNTPMKLTLDLIGNDVLSKGKPYGAVSIGCFRQIGGVAPLRNNHPLAVSINPFSKMKFTDTYVVGQEKLIAYYTFFWIDVDGNPGPESPIFPYTITS